MHQPQCFRLRRGAALGGVLVAAFNPVAWPLPQGPAVVNGQVVVSQPAAGTMLVQASNGAIINWNQFSIGAGELTRFLQPSATSAVLNRVVGQNASQILGQLQANGRVFLINPNGIVIGAGARIDTNGFIASTLDMADADFLAGKLRFFGSASSGGIRNEGLITVGPGGRIALIAPNIENRGIIQATDGKLLLAAGRKVEITSLDFEGVSFEIQAPADSVINLGKLLADNGAIQVFAGSLRHSGEIRANRLEPDADGSIRLVGSNEVTLTADSVTRADGLGGGSIAIQSTGGDARIAGEATARGEAGKGGDIRLLGERVAVEAGTTVDASGSLGGGQILVGGDYQGKNPEVQNASRVFVGDGVQLMANATTQGSGGRIIVWSNENTRYFGALAARGGPQGGNGGFAEVSGKQNLQFAGTADLTAPAGISGFLLLDPLDIVVSATGGILPIVTDEFADFSTDIVTISPTGLNAVGGNVILQAERDIYFNTPLAFTGSSLTAAANGNGSGGQIYLNQGISTSGGAVSLSGATVSGSGGISTAGGGIAISVSNGLFYSGLIASGGGNVSLSSTGGNIYYANINAGSGAVSLNATAGSLYGNTIAAGTATLNASGSISSSVNASRIDAASSGSYVQLYNVSGQPLRLGTINGNTGAYFYSSAGIEQVAGGLITSPFVYVSGQNATAAIGSAGAPLNIASPRLQLVNLGAPAYVAFAGSPTLTELYLQGNLAGLGGTSISGAANLSGFSLSAGTGVLNASATSSGGFGSGFTLRVSDAAINMPTLNLPGGVVTLDAGGGGITLGTAVAESINASAKGSIAATSVTTGGGLTLTANKCSYSYPYPLCGDTSNITVGSLTSSSGNINLYNYDNGDIDVTTLSAGGSANLQAGRVYYSYVDFNNHVTTNAINLGTVTTGGSFSATDYGNGNIAVTGPITAGGSASLSAGSSYYNYSLGHSVRTISDLSVAGIQAAGSLNLTDSGTGSITASGNLTSTSSSLSVNAQAGAVSAAGTSSAASSAGFTAGNGALALGTVSTTDGSVTGSASGSLSFQSIAANGSNRSVTLSSSTGSVRTTTDNAGSDISATGNVTITAGGAIGDGSLSHPLDILAGAGSTVSLTAGTNVGAAGKAVTVDTNGAVAVSAGGQFHVAVQDTAGSAKTLASIDLAASAAGMGSGGTSTFTSQDLSVNASSDGSTITIGNIVQSANTLDKFRFAASGASGLTFGNVDLTTAGVNQFLLSAGGALTQVSPGTNNINAGYINLAAGSGAVTVGNVTSSTATGNSINISGGDITAGNLSAPSISVSGANLSLGTVASSGTHRGYYTGWDYVARLGNYQYVTDEVSLTASGNLSTTGNITSPTSALVTAGGNLTVAGGSGNITAGNSAVCCYYYIDTAKAWAGTSGTLAAGTISGYAVDVKGGTVNTAALTAVGSLTLFGTNLNTGNLSGGGINVTGTNFNTGNMSTAGNLNVTATAGYAPGAISLSGGSLTVRAQAGGIDFSGTTVTTPWADLGATGSILGGLTNTSTLLVNTGGQLNLTSSATLGTVRVTAKGDQLGGASSISGAGGQSFSYAASGSTVNLAFTSASGVDARYAEASSGTAVTDINASANLGSGSYLNLYGRDANLTATSVALGSGSVDILSAGNVALTAVATSGSVSARSTTGNVNVESVTTTGGSVALTADAGSILRAGAQSLQIDTADISGAPSGTVTLNASAGSIGAAGTPIKVGNTNTLAVTAKNDIAVDVANTLTNLSITTNASGSGAIAINNSNYAGFTLTRVGGTDLVLGPVTPATVGDFTLNARDGNIRVNGDISVYSLSLNAATGNATGNVSILAGGGPRSVIARNTAYIAAGQDVLIEAGAANGDNATVQAGNYTTVSAGRDIIVKADGGSALLNQTSTATQSLSAGRDIRITGGSNGVAGASAAVTSSGYQNLSAGGDLVIQAGTADGASAQAQATYNQNVQANNLSVLAGAGNAAFARLQGDYQYMTGIHGNVAVQGGSGSGAYAEIVASTSSQYLGSQSTYFNNPTDDIVVQGGTGSGAYASVRAAGSQNIYGGGNISVLGSSGTGAGTSGVCGTGPGAFAEICAGGSQTLGSTGTYNNDPTANILVQAGSGGNARILASGSQSVYGGGNISVLGGSGTNMTASIQSSGGSQTIGSSSTYYSDATDNIVVQGGTAAGAAWISAYGGQTVDAGQSISLTGGTAGAYAEMVTAFGTQYVGNLNYTYYYDQTDSISLQGGTGNASYARIKSGGNQYAYSSAGMTLAGGTGDAAGASMEAAATQNVQTYGSLTLTGGSVSGAGTNETAIATTGTSQSIYASGDITLNGGGAGSSTFISQDNAGGGTQSITSGGSLIIQALTANSGGTGIDATGGANNQYVSVAGSITLDNQGGQGVYLASDGYQSIGATTLDVRLSSPLAASESAVVAGGSQDIVLNGTGVAGSATLNVTNTSAASNSMAGIVAGSNQTIRMDYDAAGSMQVGSSAGQGRAIVAAGGAQEIVVGDVLVQGGATAAALAKIQAAGTMDISALTGSVQVLGGAAGPAAIDPTFLNIATDGSITVQAGGAATATATISAGNLQLAATNGSIAVTGGSVPGATATILATGTPAPGTANLFASGNMSIVPNAGGATVTAVAPSGNNVFLGGSCIGCTSGLIGVFNITAGLLAVVNNVTGATALVDPATGNVLALLDSLQDLYGLLVLTEDGEIALDYNRRRLPQCY